jgi:hypothetical protein
MREGTTSSVMAADKLYGELYDFYSVSPDYFGYPFLLRELTTVINVLGSSHISSSMKFFPTNVG